MLNEPFYIYRHIRPDTNQVFYIGKGYELSKGHSDRHLSKHGRNKWWYRIVAKNNGEYKVEIMYHCATEEEVNAKEREFIKLYGRRDLVQGTLCNLTDGGDGAVGAVVSAETRKKISEKFSGANHPNWGKKFSEETCKKLSDSLRNSPNNLKGKKLPDWWRDKIRQTKFGADNPMYGKHTPVSKKVINVETGEIFPTILLAGQSIGLKGRLLHQYLSGHRVNKSPFVYLSVYESLGKDECLKLINRQPKEMKGNSKDVVDIKTGTIYKTAKEAADLYGWNDTYLRCMLAGTKKNHTTLRYANGL